MQQAQDETVENIRMLSESTIAVVPDDASLDRIRAARFEFPGYSRDVWTKIVELGWLGLRVEEAAGGAALGLRETMAISRILGAGLLPEPFLPSLLALDLMASAKAENMIGSVLRGERLVVPAWQSAPNAPKISGGVSIEGGRLHGMKIVVATGADIFAVTTPNGLALVPSEAEGLTIRRMQMHDGTFRDDLKFDGVACDLHPCTSMQDCLREAMLLHAGFLQGAAERAFEITLEYLRTRTQFDAPIGSFQALQHRASEIKVQLELARAAIDAAAMAVDHGQSHRRVAMAILRARTRAGGLARLVAREAVQMHGAIGYADESDIGLFVRKLMVEAGQFAPEYLLRAEFMKFREATV